MENQNMEIIIPHQGKQGRYKKGVENIDLRHNKEHVKNYNKMYYEMTKHQKKIVKTKYLCECGKTYVNMETHERSLIHKYHILQQELKNKKHLEILV
jgi:hypothetical protein